MIQPHRETGVEAPTRLGPLPQANQGRIGIAFKHIDADLRALAGDSYIKTAASAFTERGKQPHEAHVVGVAFRHMPRQIYAVMVYHAILANFERHPPRQYTEVRARYKTFHGGWYTR